MTTRDYFRLYSWNDAAVLSDFDAIIAELGLWNWLENGGYHGTDLYLKDIAEEVKQLMRVMKHKYHVETFVWAMDNMEFIAINGWEKWEDLRLMKRREAQVGVIEQFNRGEISEITMISLLEKV